MHRLFAARYENELTNPDMLEWIDDPANVGIRWSIPGGVQRVELTMRAKSKLDAYDRYHNHHGQRMAIPDDFVDRPVVDGWIYEIVPDGRHVHYIIGGPWKRHNDEPYKVSDFPGTGNTDAIIRDALTNRVPVVSSDQSHIANTGTAIGAWSPAENVGTPVQRVIEELGLMSNGNHDIFDYWLRSAPLGRGLTLQKPIPYFQARSNTEEADWVVELNDLAPGGASFSRHIWELKREVSVAYGRLNGEHSGANGSADLIDDGVNFIAAGVNIGDTVINVTDGCSGRVEDFAQTGATANDTLVITRLSGGTDNDFDSFDRYTIKLQKLLIAGAIPSTETDLWTTAVTIAQPDMNATQAQQFRTRLQAEYEKAVQQQAFTITAPRLKSGTNKSWPLWRPIQYGGGYIRGHGLHQWAGLFETSLDRLQAFRITAMDYDYRSNQLRVVPDTVDSRLDVIMKRAGIVAGEVVSRRDMPPRGQDRRRRT